MGIQTQLCGLLLLLTVLVLWLLQPRIKLKTQRIYAGLLIAGIVCLVFDGYSVLVISSAQPVSVYVKTICRIYLITLEVLSCTSFLYLTADLESHIPYIKVMRRLCYVWGGISALASCILPLHVHNEAGEIYTYGGGVIVTYVSAGGMVLVNLIIMMRHKKHMDKRRWLVGIIWQVQWLVAALVQFLFSSLLLVGFSAAIGITIVFIKLENPESYLDRVTGVFNDQALRAYLDDNYKRNKSFQLLSVCLTQIKHHDEALSPAETELLARQLAMYFHTIVFEEVFKHSGWEYTILFDERESMERAAYQISHKFTEFWEVNDKKLRLDSFIVEMPDSSIATRSDELLELRRVFVESGKKQGLKGIQFLDSRWTEQIMHDREIAMVIQEAIKENRVEVFYQPIYSTSEKRYVSAEALMRIRKTDGSILPPGEFIPVAEANGMILQLDEIVFRKVCEFIRKERLREKGIHYLEVNLSAVQTSKSYLADEYIQIMREVGVDPKMINLEITESAAINSKDTLLANMEKLSAYGVRFSLDDFGTGYSNLNYIMELPVQVVKFDRQMTNSYFENEKSRLIMEAAIEMIKAVDMNIVSEGVETKEQLEELERVDINFIQGFYFSKPVPGNEFIQKLEKQNF
ncbi:MAG: EAL domain-containing protein [Acetatifactor sp.]